MICEFTLPIRTKSEMNMHEHWRARQRRAREQRFAAKFIAIGELAKDPPAFETRKTITLTRIAPGKLDSDNLAGSMKHVRDGIADALRSRWAVRRSSR